MPPTFSVTRLLSKVSKVLLAAYIVFFKASKNRADNWRTYLENEMMIDSIVSFRSIIISIIIVNEADQTRLFENKTVISLLEVSSSRTFFLITSWRMSWFWGVWGCLDRGDRLFFSPGKKESLSTKNSSNSTFLLNSFFLSSFCTDSQSLHSRKRHSDVMSRIKWTLLYFLCLDFEALSNRSTKEVEWEEMKCLICIWLPCISRFTVKTRNWRGVRGKKFPLCSLSTQLYFVLSKTVGRRNTLSKKIVKQKER